MINTSSNYFDLAKLESLKTPEAAKDGQNVRAVAEQFEQIFLGMMLQSMRDANAVFKDEDSINAGHAMGMYESMHDQQVTLAMAQSGGVGLADMLVKQLTPKTQSAADLANLELNWDARQVRSARAAQSEDIELDTLGLTKAVHGADIAGAQYAGLKIYRSGSVHQSQVIQGIHESNWAREKTVVHKPFKDAQAFIDTVGPIAKKAAKELGVDPKVLLAQSALETGWGMRLIGRRGSRSSMNLFNIKSHGNWDGPSVTVITTEYVNGKPRKERANFRAYESLEASFKDYIRLIKENERYHAALKKANDPIGYIQALKKGGYATDPRYVQKIESIYSSDILKRFK